MESKHQTDLFDIVKEVEEIQKRLQKMCLNEVKQEIVPSAVKTECVRAEHVKIKYTDWLLVAEKVKAAKLKKPEPTEKEIRQSLSTLIDIKKSHCINLSFQCKFKEFVEEGLVLRSGSKGPEMILSFYFKKTVNLYSFTISCDVLRGAPRKISLYVNTPKSLDLKSVKTAPADDEFILRENEVLQGEDILLPLKIRHKSIWGVQVHVETNFENYPITSINSLQLNGSEEVLSA